MISFYYYKLSTSQVQAQYEGTESDANPPKKKILSLFMYILRTIISSPLLSSLYFTTTFKSDGHLPITPSWLIDSEFQDTISSTIVRISLGRHFLEKCIQPLWTTYWHSP